MIALAPVPRSKTPRPPSSQADWPGRFLLLLPLIRKVARHAFRRLNSEQRDDAVQEVIASAYVAFARLVQRGREDVAFATPLARYAIAQYRSGRRVGSQLNVHDVSSPYCEMRNNIVLESLHWQTDSGNWREVLVEDRRSTPADIAATRLDFRAWLRRLDRPKRAAAKLLAEGTSTMEVAKKLGLSPSRISQLRAELKDDWAEFQGEKLAATAA